MIHGVLIAVATLLAIGDSVTMLGEPPFSEVSGYEVLNVGVSGSTTRDWLQEGGPGCAAYVCGALYQLDGLPTPDVVHVMLGTNDASGSWEAEGPTSVAEYEINLTTIVNDLLARWPDALVLVSTPPPAAGRADLVDRRHDGYRKAVHRVAKHTGARFGVDFYRKIPLEEMENVHPFQQGYDHMRRRLARRLQHLERCRAPETW